MSKKVHNFTLMVFINYNFYLFSNRRKPQNLTPPLSSDGGSSTSGQSPTSTHNGSPPPAVKRPPLNSDKYSEVPTKKKPRISHFNKDVSHDNRLDIICSLPSNNDNMKSLNPRRNVVDSRDSANLNPRSREPDSSYPYRLVQIKKKTKIKNVITLYFFSSSGTPTNAPESEDSGISFSLLGSEAAKRISTSSTSEQDTEKDSFEEDTKMLRQKVNSTANGPAHGHDFR